jgi:hypothetical protein
MKLHREVLPPRTAITVADLAMLEARRIEAERVGRDIRVAVLVGAVLAFVGQVVIGWVL